MRDYLKEIDFAAKHLIGLISHDRARAASLKKQVASLSKEVRHNYQRVESIVHDPGLPDDDGIGTGLHWETYFGPDKALHKDSKALEKLNQQIATNAFSYDSLA